MEMLSLAYGGNVMHADLRFRRTAMNRTFLMLFGRRIATYYQVKTHHTYIYTRSRYLGRMNQMPQYTKHLVEISTVNKSMDVDRHHDFISKINAQKCLPPSAVHFSISLNPKRHD